MGELGDPAAGQVGDPELQLRAAIRRRSRRAAARRRAAAAAAGSGMPACRGAYRATRGRAVREEGQSPAVRRPCRLLGARLAAGADAARRRRRPTGAAGAAGAGGAGEVADKDRRAPGRAPVRAALALHPGDPPPVRRQGDRLEGVQGRGQGQHLLDCRDLWRRLVRRGCPCWRGRDRGPGRGSQDRSQQSRGAGWTASTISGALGDHWLSWGLGEIPAPAGWRGWR